MNVNKLPLLRAIFRYFGNASTTTRLRWGALLGWLARKLLRSRVNIVRVNLQLCFPEHTQQQRDAWLREHFHLLGQSVVDRGLCWFGPPEAITRTISLNGFEHIQALLDAKRPIILLAPHFIGLDAAATRITLAVEEIGTIYTRQSDADVDRMMQEGRSRFSNVHLIGRHEGVRRMIRLLRNGVPIYYLPDMDFGRSDGTVFSPFFNVPAATLLATAQIARSCKAAVVPIVTNLDIKTGHYSTQVLAPIDDFPGEGSLEAATDRLNKLIEDWVRVDPPQYYWVHRRFKTRPLGEKKFY